MSAPWFVSEEPRVGGYAIESAEHGVLAVSIQRSAGSGASGRIGITDEQAKEHAHLIAAAPDLLDALERMVAFQESLGEAAPGWVSAIYARAAIAKARGEQ